MDLNTKQKSEKMDNIYLKSELKVIAERVTVLNEIRNSSGLVTGAAGLVGSLAVRAFDYLNYNCRYCKYGSEEIWKS
jgi:hypothetical protein